MGKVHMGRKNRMNLAAPQIVVPASIAILNDPITVQPIVEPQIIYVDREVPIEKIITVDRHVDVIKFVDREVEKIVEKVKEVPVEVIRYVDREVERIMYKDVIHIGPNLELKKTIRHLEKQISITRFALAAAVILMFISFVK